VDFLGLGDPSSGYATGLRKTGLALQSPIPTAFAAVQSNEVYPPPWRFAFPNSFAAADKRFVSHMQVTIDLTGFLAIWGAVLSTIAIVWDVYKWRTSGPNLQMRVMTGMEAFNIPEYEGKTLIVAVVTNRGDRPTTITHLAVAYYDAWWKAMLRKRSAANGWIATPSTTQRVPFELKPGVEWSGMIDQTKELEVWAREGWLYATIYHSHDRKPIRQRISIQAPKAR
jgi:hypothetical protein